MNLNISADDNWYHFLWQKLPALSTGWSDGPFYVGSPNLIQMQALLSSASILSRELRWGDLPGLETAPVPAENERVSFLKKLADSIEGKNRGTRRIFLSRRGFSRYGGSIERFALALGCEVIYLHEMTFCAQVAAMRQSSLVVSQIGSALVNIPFCNPGTQVIELCLDPNQARVYGNLADLAGCKWERIQL